MKNKLTPKQNAWFGLGLMCLLLIGSCKKDLTVPEPQEQRKTKASAKLSPLNLWFEAHKSDLLRKDNWLNSFSPNWESLKTSEENGHKVYEIDLYNPQKIFSVGEGSTTENKETLLARSLFKLLIFEDEKGGFKACFMEITAAQDHSNLQAMGYRAYQDLSGMVNFYHFNGQLINGWLYSRGKITASIKPTAEERAVNSNRNTKTAVEGDCGTIDITHWELECFSTTGIVGYPGGGYEKCTWGKSVATEKVYCGPVSGGGGADGGGGTGGGTEGDGELMNIGENRFTMRAADQQKYPRFTQMVKELSSFVKNDAKVLAALKKWSGFTEAQILEKVKFGQGPEIVIKELKDSDLYGYFDRLGNTNAVTINASWVRGLEQANLIGTQQGTGFVLAVTILHEFVHLGRNENSLDADSWEYGYGFEQSSFATFITRDNAGKYSYRFYKK